MYPITDPNRIERQLAPLGTDRATTIASIAAGVDSTLTQEPFWKHILPILGLPAIAALYGTALRICRDSITQGNDEEIHVAAQATLDVMTQIVALTDAPDPSPRDPVAAFLASIGATPGPTTPEAVGVAIEGEATEQ